MCGKKIDLILNGSFQQVEAVGGADEVVLWLRIGWSLM